MFDNPDVSVATNLVSSQPSGLDTVVPVTSDSLWGDVAEHSSYSPPAKASGDGGLGAGGGGGAIIDSMAYIAANVDKSAALDGVNAKPAYPADMLRRMIEASFSVYFVVDTTGRIDTSTIQIPPSVHPRFAQAVREVLVKWHFVPAEIRGRRVRQMMEQPFEFRIVSGQYT